MCHVIVLIAAGALMAESAAAQPAAPAPAPVVVANPTVEGYAPPKAPKDPDPLVCRSETPIGSKLPVKVCVRKSDRDRQKQDSQEALQLIQRRSDGPMKTDPRFQ
jgi:parvulin-like peptidyl-prolyl isomerase